MFKRAVRIALGLFVVLATGCGYQSCGVMDWSPDGKRLVTTLPFGGKAFGLVTVDVATGAVQRIPGGEEGLSPSWSPDGRYIAAVRANKSDTVLRLVDLRRGTARSIMAGVSGLIIWREDGQSLFTVKSTFKGTRGIWYSVSNSQVTAECVLPDGGAQATSDLACWLPDSDDVALVLGGDVYRTQGQQVEQVTHNGRVVGLGLSPDGRNLHWASTKEDGSGLALTRYSLSSGETRRLPLRSLVPANVHVGYVVFSRDGRRLALILLRSSYTSPPSKESPRGERINWETDQCIVARIDGTQARTVWRAKPGTRVAQDVMLSFSRDGKRLALLASAGERIQLLVGGADGYGMHRLLTRVNPSR